MTEVLQLEVGGAALDSAFEARSVLDADPTDLAGSAVRYEEAARSSVDVYGAFLYWLQAGRLWARAENMVRLLFAAASADDTRAELPAEHQDAAAQAYSSFLDAAIVRH